MVADPPRNALSLFEHSRRETSSESAEEPAQRNQRFSARYSSPQERSPNLNLLRQFLTVYSEITLSWSILISSLWMSLIPYPSRKKYFTITLCSIRSIQIFITYFNVYIKYRSKGPQRQILWTDFLAEHIWLIQNWFSFDDVIQPLTILSPEKDRQEVRYFFTTLY
jgi:hypothetical protein